jgi:predicted dehydrogenase
MTVRRGDIRTKRAFGGGTLYDIGVYCINAARNLFRAEPTQVSAVSINSGLASLSEIDETTAATLRFGTSASPLRHELQCRGCRLVSHRRHEGHLHADPAYEYAEGLEYALTIDGRRPAGSSASATSSRPSCCIFRIASSTIERRSRR